MYILTNSIIETIKTFCISILCSAIFSFMIYRDTVLIQNVACFILNLASFLLFLFLYYKNWSNFYSRTYAAIEYIIPVATSFIVYAGASTYFYITKASLIYRWVFQHTRFLEPMLNSKYAFVSFIIAQVLTLAVIFIVPMTCEQKN